MNATSNGSNDDATILDSKVVLVTISVGNFGGYRRATSEAITSLGGKLPDCSAITEGSIKVFPGKPLAEGRTIRRGVFRKMARRGIKALGSPNTFCIPAVDLEDATKELDDAKRRFLVFRTKVEANYDQNFEQHVKDSIGGLDPEKALVVETMLRSKKFERSEAVSKLHFTWVPFRIKASDAGAESGEDGVSGIVRGLGRQLFEEVSNDFERLVKKDTFVKNRVGQRVRISFKAAIGKLAGLRFLDERCVDGAIKLIDETMAVLPPQGFIMDSPLDAPFSRLCRLVDILRDVDDLVNAASKVANGVAVNEVLYPPVVKVQVQAPEPAPVQPAADSSVAEKLAEALLEGAVSSTAITEAEEVAVPDVVARTVSERRKPAGLKFAPKF